MLITEDRMRAVQYSLAEDLGSGDITAELVDEQVMSAAHLFVRQPAVICGVQWVNEVFRQVGEGVDIDWQVSEGDEVGAETLLAVFSGPARLLLTGERCALNWLQTLSGVATEVRRVVSLIAGSNARILDTRKTIPGMRLAQKYAVTVGGGKNHRMGLFDAFLIKENHIMSAGSISKAIGVARQQHAGKPVEVEVENLAELDEALAAGADIIMCDNFSIELLAEAVQRNRGRAKLEASGNVDDSTVKAIAHAGVDYISMGALTKHLRAVDLSMRFLSEKN